MGALIKTNLETIVKDRGLNRFLNELTKLKGGSFVQIGIQSNAPDPEDGKLNMAQIASVHEFGTRDKKIPERSFIRTTMDEKNRTFSLLTDNQLSKIGRGETTVNKALNVLGQLIASAIKRKITLLQDPPNAPSTIAKKGSSNPLLDTGRMRASIRPKVIIKKESLNARIARGGAKLE